MQSFIHLAVCDIAVGCRKIVAKAKPQVLYVQVQLTVSFSSFRAAYNDKRLTVD